MKDILNPRDTGLWDILGLFRAPHLPACYIMSDAIYQAHHLLCQVTLCQLSHLMLTPVLGGRYCFYPRVTDEETEARGGTASKWRDQDSNLGSWVPQPERPSPHHSGEEQGGALGCLTTL